MCCGVRQLPFALTMSPTRPGSRWSQLHRDTSLFDGPKRDPHPACALHQVIGCYVPRNYTNTFPFTCLGNFNTVQVQCSGLKKKSNDTDSPESYGLDTWEVTNNSNRRNSAQPSWNQTHNLTVYHHIFQHRKIGRVCQQWLVGVAVFGPSWIQRKFTCSYTDWPLNWPQ